MLKHDVVTTMVCWYICCRQGSMLEYDTVTSMVCCQRGGMQKYDTVTSMVYGMLFVVLLCY